MIVSGSKSRRRCRSRKTTMRNNYIVILCLTSDIKPYLVFGGPEASQVVLGGLCRGPALAHGQLPLVVVGVLHLLGPVAQVPGGRGWREEWGAGVRGTRE